MSSSVGEASPALSDRSVSSAEDAGVLPGVPTSPMSSPVRERPRNSASVTPQNPFSTMEANTPQSPTRSQITQGSPHPSPSSPGTAAPATPQEVPLLRLPQSAPAANHTNNNNSSTPMTSTALFQHAATAPRPQRQQEIQNQNNSFALDDDENTEPSSMGANDSSDNNNNPASEQRKRSTSFARFVRYTRRHLSFGQDDDDDKDDSHGDHLPENSVICGYLQKLGRNGKWQTRWFETDGECLSYYKSSKRVKLLATLDLEKVGQIEVNESDEKGCSFCIQVLGRMYHLRAESRASCKDWVINLNRVKEARMQQGNVKLVDPAYTQPVDLLDPASGDVVAPRIVVVANRERTRAVDQDQEWDDLMTRQEQNNNNIRNNMASNPQHSNSSLSSEKRRSTLGTVVLARWSKRKTSLNRLSAKLVRWARSVRKYGCATEQSVHLDHHVHPPGHDYHSKQAKQLQSNNNNLNAWIGKETSRSAMGVVGDSEGGAGAADSNNDEDNNASDDNNTNRHLVPNTSKPGQISREISDASEDGGARYLL